MVNHRPSKSFVGFAAAAAVATLVLGCTSTGETDSAGNEMRSGIADARSGLSKAQSGVGSITAGSREAGMSSLSDGMGMMGKGVNEMRQGMGMMSGTMMMNCADGGSNSILEPMQQAMTEMQQCQGILAADAGASDDAIACMQTGMAMMATALDHAQDSVNCMGHNGMISGGMM